MSNTQEIVTKPLTDYSLPKVCWVSVAKTDFEKNLPLKANLGWTKVVNQNVVQASTDKDFQDAIKIALEVNDVKSMDIDNITVFISDTDLNSVYSLTPEQVKNMDLAKFNLSVEH